MTVCQYYLRGQCKFGSTCKNEHPGHRPGGFGASGGPSGSAVGPMLIPFSQEGVEKDLIPGAERPSWPLSSYGCAKYEPTIIVNLDESAEELRWWAVQALKAGNLADYQKYETEKIQEANQTYAKALSEIAQLYKHASNLNKASQAGIPSSAEVAYNSPNNTASAAFGKPQPNAFGTSSTFGSGPQAPPATSGFGGASGSNPAFGQSSFGKPAFGRSAFGQPAYGQSTFGQAAKPPSAFGQTAPSTSAFGGEVTSAFGQASQPQSSFVKPASGAFGGGASGGAFSAFAGGTSAFGAGAQQTTAPAFGQSSFGGAAGSGMSSSPFANALQSADRPSTGFGSNANQTPSAFGSSAQPATNAFGQTSQPTSAFGQAAKPVSAFGQAAQPTSAFGQPPQPSAFGQTSQPSAFGQTSQPSAFGQPSQPAQPSAFSQSALSTSAFSRPSLLTSVFGTPGSGTGTSSAFGTGAGLPAKPKVGPPDFAAALASTKPQPGRDKHDSMLPADYAERIPPAAKEAFAAPRFEWGKIPEWLPPIELR